jgi:hypothetical protein
MLSDVDRQAEELQLQLNWLDSIWKLCDIYLLEPGVRGPALPRAPLVFATPVFTLAPLCLSAQGRIATETWRCRTAAWTGAPT